MEGKDSMKTYLDWGEKSKELDMFKVCGDGQER